MAITFPANQGSQGLVSKLALRGGAGNKTHWWELNPSSPQSVALWVLLLLRQAQDDGREEDFI